MPNQDGELKVKSFYVGAVDETEADVIWSAELTTGGKSLSDDSSP